MRSSADPWLRRYHPAPDAPARLVCLPHAGGSASYFFPVSQALSPSVDVLAVQYPGRQDRREEPLVGTVEELADRIGEALLPWADRPLTLFGHSMGASVGYEVALRLEAAGIVPTALFVSGRRAPSQYREETVHLRDDDGLIAEIKALSGTDTSLLADEDVLRMILPALRSDYRAAETYRPAGERRLACPVQALIGDADTRCTAEEARAWAAHTNGRFDLQVLPGGHFYLTNHAQTVMGSITKHIDAHLAGS